METASTSYNLILMLYFCVFSRFVSPGLSVVVVRVRLPSGDGGRLLVEKAAGVDDVFL